jgi:hypothetical protein
MCIGPFGAGTTTFFDAAFTTGDGSSRLFNTDVNSPTGSTDTEALITGFVIVPEPGTAMLLVGGGTLLAWFGGCRRRQRH